MNRQRGMTMVELLVSVAIVMIIIAAATTAYLKILRSYKTHGKLAESYMANLTGLEMLRYDIETAGFGLPAGMNGVTYSEAVPVNTPETTFTAATNPNPNPPYDPSALNDSPSNPPRAFAHLDNKSTAGMGTNKSDVLSIKSSSANINATSKKWSILVNPSGTPIVKLWGANYAPPGLDQFMDFTSVPPADNFIVLDNNGNLVANQAGHWLNTFNASAVNTGYYNNATFLCGLPSGPPSAMSVYYMYGLDNSTLAHTMPFNRVDYYLDRIKSDFPTSCDKNTFTLYRSTINQWNGQFTQTPLIDCVADFQVAFGLDPLGGTNNSTGDPVAAIQWQANLLQQSWMPGYSANTPMSAIQIQQYLREVRVFILFQEGLGDTSTSSDLSSHFRFSGTLNLGDQAIANSLDPADYTATGTNFQQLSSAALPGTPNSQLSCFTPAGVDQQYRWKIIELDVKPMNLINLTQR
jgi:prepilin-type N-terminal cleavage/methylation domain-containing protein